MATLHIIRGKPGSCKSTFAKQRFPGILLLENDMFHMHDGDYDWHAENMKDAISWCAEMAETALANSMDVVIANTFTKRKYIEFYKKLADEHHAKFDVYRCTGNFKNVHGLTDSMVQKFEDSMEDWPGEILVRPERRMACEVFDLSTDEVYGQFPSVREADMFIAGLNDELTAQVQIRQIAA